MVEEKQLRNSHVKVEENSRVKHNPITNPIEYHVENPYLLKKMQEKRLILKLSWFDLIFDIHSINYKIQFNGQLASHSPSRHSFKNTEGKCQDYIRNYWTAI